MTQINITLEEEILKDLFMGNREKSVTILLEQVINAVLSKQASEQLNAQPYERSEDRLTYRNGYRERELTTRVGTLMRLTVKTAPCIWTQAPLQSIPVSTS